MKPTLRGRRRGPSSCPRLGSNRLTDVQPSEDSTCSRLVVTVTDLLIEGIEEALGWSRREGWKFRRFGQKFHLIALDSDLVLLSY